MNAIEKATNLSIISRIEAISYLLKSKFPGVIIDLKPWAKNVETDIYGDHNSLDIGLHFSQLNLPCQCRSILMQVKLHEDTVTKNLKVIGVTLAGYESTYALWQFTTIGGWQFTGEFPPTLRAQERFKQVCRQVFELFEEE